jgi:hypothetical protein
MYRTFTELSSFVNTFSMQLEPSAPTPVPDLLPEGRPVDLVKHEKKLLFFFLSFS